MNDNTEMLLMMMKPLKVKQMCNDEYQLMPNV